jgi:NAD(P)H-hydrate epimerase
VAPYLPVRDERGHKGTFGTLLAVCGSLDYTGAALLAGAAALRAGAGLVILCVPASLQPIVAGRIPELITLGLPETAPHGVDPAAAAEVLHARPHTALLVGPGLASGEGTDALVSALVGQGPGKDGSGGQTPMVVDAEALNALARQAAWWEGRSRACVLTPHPGEFGRLEGTPLGPDDAERHERALTAARRWDVTLVLKGARTVVAAPDGRSAVADFANPALATGGTGDVLAGVIGSLLAQGVSPWEAACLGVVLHGSAAADVRARTGDAGMLASDLLSTLPRVRRHLATRRDRSDPSGPRIGFVPRG